MNTNTNTKKIRLVVVNEHTLAYMIDDKNAGVIRASVLKGSSHKDCDIFSTQYSKVRLASAKDFEEYRVCFKGFDNTEEYEFATEE